MQEIRFSPAITFQPDWRPDRIDELDRAFEAVFDLSVEHFLRTGEVPVAVFRRGDAPLATPGEIPMCAVADAEKIAVDVNGQLHGCVTFAESYQTFPTTFLRSRMEALRLGGIHDAEFETRFGAYPAAVRASGLFHDKRTKYSSYGRCADCRYLTTCSFCPVSIGHQPGNSDPDRVPDFLCAYNLVSLKYRERFPKMPSLEDILEGPASLARLVWELAGLDGPPPLEPPASIAYT